MSWVRRKFNLKIVCMCAIANVLTFPLDFPMHMTDPLYDAEGLAGKWIIAGVGALIFFVASLWFVWNPTEPVPPVPPTTVWRQRPRRRHEVRPVAVSWRPKAAGIRRPG